MQKVRRPPPPRSPMPEIIDSVFAKTSQNARFLLSENERFGLVFVKTGSINSGTVMLMHRDVVQIHRMKDSRRENF
jgi:hypothetical protein